MDFYFLIGYRNSELNKIPIWVKYTLNGRPINLTTDIVALAIDLLDRKDINDHWNLRVLVSNKHSLSQSFILFLESFIWDVFITDFVLNNICAFNLMKFQNKFKDHDLSQEEYARLDNLWIRMLLMGITIFVQEDLFFCGGSSTEKPDLAMFRYKVKDEELLMKIMASQSKS